VFVVVTLLVALGIAAAQGCQGPANGLRDDDRGRTGVRHEQLHRQPDRQPYVPSYDTGPGRGGGPGKRA
jgi:hypothetical protein